MEWINAILSAVLLVVVIYSGHLSNVYHDSVDKYQQNNAVALQAAFNKITELEDDNERIVRQFRAQEKAMQDMKDIIDRQDGLINSLYDVVKSNDAAQQEHNRSFAKSIRRIANLARGEEIETDKKSKKTA
ncbi:MULTISPECIES: hypothetical protein [Lactobacillus]|uniref:Uncharacterized protein n=1 Tax=Lactobacillus xujianguonis TaxID=2495899 RepID=A0A437STD0_9LACO|nr:MULTISPECIES: hypothetical protein [Lactobacillus]RVU70183.1 hypothetical protein EJK17_09130 [Lactobacillus xujianguonis]